MVEVQRSPNDFDRLRKLAEKYRRIEGDTSLGHLVDILETALTDAEAAALRWETEADQLRQRLDKYEPPFKPKKFS